MSPNSWRTWATFERARRWWGWAIVAVMVVAVGPYPIKGLVQTSEVVHRLHDTVGAVQYLVLWAVPVAVWATRPGAWWAWRLALSTSLAIAGAAAVCGGLWSSGSWLPLGTLVVLWPTGVRWRHWARPGPVSVAGLLGALGAVGVAVTSAPHLLARQMDYPHDIHGARFHYGGTATAYVAVALGAVVAVCWWPQRRAAALVGAAMVGVGAANAVWWRYESAIAAPAAWALIGSGMVLVTVALARWPGSQRCFGEAGRTRSSSSRPRPMARS